MNMLVVDSGGTHTIWITITDDGKQASLESLGLNPNRIDETSLTRVLESQVKPWLAPQPPSHCYFFGAGLGTEVDREAMAARLRCILPQDCVLTVATDMLGAAYACLGQQQGVVGILGTGSVAFSFDGQEITARKGGLGHMLGDKGSGTSLGRSLLRHLLNGNLSPGLVEKHAMFSGLDKEQLRYHLNHHRRPASFLADQAPFLSRYWDEPEISEILQEEFGYFLRNDLLPLVVEDTRQVALCGGVARNFSPALGALCSSYGLERVTIYNEPPVSQIAKFLHKRMLAN